MSTTTPARSLLRLLAMIMTLAIVAAACSSDDGDEGETSATVDTATICSADALVSAVQAGADEGTLEGMADDPVGTAASNNPVLTTLVTAVSAAGLVDTLNSAPALTVFAPTDCAFAALDPATLQAALDDPNGLLTQVLGFHVIPGERLTSAQLTGGELTTFTDATLPYTNEGGTITLDGQATVVVPDIQTANATVHLISNVMVPGDDTAAADAGAGAAVPADSSTICDTQGLIAAVESGAAEGTLAGMADDPVGTAASSNPVLTTLVTAVSEAGLVDTLNSAEALTVFAPTDCAFANLDPATLEAALADPQGLLTTVLGFHVIPGQRLSFADLQGGELTTFTGAQLPYTFDGTGHLFNGQATIVVPDIQTANATVHLIDQVMIPAS